MDDLATKDNKKYNGWANYATWRVQLELVSDHVNSLLEDGETEVSAEQLKDFVDEVLTSYASDTEQNIALDYARAFVDDVDWHELAESANETLAEG